MPHLIPRADRRNPLLNLPVLLGLLQFPLATLGGCLGLHLHCPCTHVAPSPSTSPWTEARADHPCRSALSLEPTFPPAPGA